MKITIICVGKIKERFYREALEEYGKRLGRYCRLEVIEVSDEKTPDGAGAALEEQIREKEGKRILEKIREDMLVCTLEISGKRFSSEKLAAWLEGQTVKGVSHITFVIGGSLGLHESVTKRSDMALSFSDMKMSFSDMTFPHQLMRVILEEQIYRCFRIINGEPYHK